MFQIFQNYFLILLPRWKVQEKASGENEYKLLSPKASIFIYRNGLDEWLCGIHAKLYSQRRQRKPVSLWILSLFCPHTLFLSPFPLSLLSPLLPTSEILDKGPTGPFLCTSFPYT